MNYRNCQFLFLCCLISLTSPLFGQRSRKDFLELYQKSSPPRPKRPEPNLFVPAAMNKNIPMATYFFTLSSRNEANKNLAWRAYYQGQIVPQKEGVFFLTAPKHLDSFNIVVAVIKKPNQTTIASLEVPYGVDYIHYQLEKREDFSNQKKYRWKIIKEEGNQGFVVPHDALIILLEPQYIEKLEVHSWEKRSDIIMLPTIVLAGTQALQEASIKTVLAALDTDLLHSRSESEQTQKDGITLSRIKQV